MFDRQPGIVLADINPVYLNSLLPEGYVAAHLDGQRIIAFRDVHGYDRAQALAFVKRGLAQSLPIYALFVSREEMEEKMARLPQVDGYNWVPGGKFQWQSGDLKAQSKQLIRLSSILTCHHIDVLSKGSPK
jgi:hypothetical protein